MCRMSDETFPLHKESRISKPMVKTRWVSDRGPSAAIRVASWRGRGAQPLTYVLEHWKNAVKSTSPDLKLLHTNLCFADLRFGNLHKEDVGNHVAFERALICCSVLSLVPPFSES